MQGVCLSNRSSTTNGLTLVKPLLYCFFGDSAFFFSAGFVFATLGFAVLVVLAAVATFFFRVGLSFFATVAFFAAGFLAVAFFGATAVAVFFFGATT